MRLFTGSCGDKVEQKQNELDEMWEFANFCCAIKPSKIGALMSGNSGIADGALDIASGGELTRREQESQGDPIAAVMLCNFAHLKAGGLYGLLESQYEKWSDMGICRAATPEELEAWRAAGGYEQALYQKEKGPEFTPPTYRGLMRGLRESGLRGRLKNKDLARRHLALDRKHG